MLNKLRTIPLPLAAVALLAAVYVVVRAVVVPFTWDESFSWLMYARGHDWWPEINSEMAANNHLLNTWLMRLSEMIFGTSEFTLRLPNVLFSLLYFTAAFFFAKRQEKTLAQLAVFIVLAGHPYLLDYFGIARGYGLAHSLLLFGLWLLWKWCNGEKLFYAVAALVAFSLSCFASLTQLHVLAGATVVVVARFLMLPSARQWEGRFVRVQLLLLPGAFTFGLLVPYSMELKAANALFFGPRGSWFQGTWRSVTDRMLYDLNCPTILLNILAALLLLTAIAGVIAAGIFMFRVVKRKANSETAFVFLLGGIIAASVFGPLIQYNLLKTKLLFERTALFYIPILSLMFVQLLRLIPKQQIAATVLYSSALPILFIIAFAGNFSRVHDWADEQDMNLIVAEINKQLQPEKAIAISSDWQFYPDLEFALAMNRFSENVNSKDIHDNDQAFDYLLVYDREMKKYSNFEIVKKFPRSRTSLLKLKSFPNLKRIALLTENFEKVNSKTPTKQYKDKYGKINRALLCGGENTYPWDIEYGIPDSLSGKLLRLHTSFDAQRGVERNGYNIVVMLERGGERIETTGLRIDHCIYENNKWSNTSSVVPLRTPLQSGDTLQIQLFMPSKSELLIDNISFSVETFSPY
jgi:hypothetical protein